MLAPYGWQWEPDLTLVLARPGAATRGERDELAGELRQEREDAHQQRVQKIRDSGEAWTTANIKLQDSATLRTSGDVLRLKRALLKDSPKMTTAQEEEAWKLSCELVLDAGDNKRKVNRAERRLKISHLRGRCAFTENFYRAFAVGERLTAEEVHRRVLAIFASDALMSYYAATRYRYHLSLIHISEPTRPY